ncbi:hypothetical protein ACRCPS_17820 [Pseudomonas aeruginosa]
MSPYLTVEQPFISSFAQYWLRTIRSAWPFFVRLIPLYLLVTITASVISVFTLLVLGKAAFHVACMFSPLIFVVVGMAIAKADPSERRAFSPAAWLPVATRFWRYGAPLALAIGLTLNVIVLFTLFLSDLGSWRSGALPNLAFPEEMFSEEKRPLFLILLTTSVEQQLLFMPLFVVLGGRLEPHLVGRILGGSLTFAAAKLEQAKLTKRQTFFLSPMRLLVLVGVGLQFAAKELDATKTVAGPVLLLGSYLGWLYYACLLACISRQSAESQP